MIWSMLNHPSPRLWGSMGICSPKAKRHMSSVRRATSSTAVLPAVWQVWAAGMGSVGSWQATSFRTIFQQMQGNIFPFLAVWLTRGLTRETHPLMSPPCLLTFGLHVPSKITIPWTQQVPSICQSQELMPMQVVIEPGNISCKKQAGLPAGWRYTEACQCHPGDVALLLPGVLQKAVAEVSKIRNLKEMWIVVMHGWQSEPTWWTERWLRLCVCPSLSLSFCNSLRHPLCVSLCLSLWLSIYLSIILSVA